MRSTLARPTSQQDAMWGGNTRSRSRGRAFSFLLLASLATATLAGCSRPVEETPPPYTDELLDARLGLGTVYDLAYEPGGSPATAAIASSSGSIYLWSLAHGCAEAVLTPDGPRSPARSVAFSSDGSRIVAAFEDGRIAAWTRSGQLLHLCKQEKSTFTCMSLVGDLKVVVGCADGRLLLWDLSAPQPQQEVAVHAGGVTCLARGADRLWSAGADGTTAAWKLGELALQGRSPALGSAIRSLSVSDDQSHLFAGSDDGNVRDLDPQGLTLRSTSSNLIAPVTALACQGGKVVAGTSKQTLSWWEIGREASKHDLSANKGAIYCARFTPDGQSVAAGGTEKVVLVTPLSGKQPPNTWPTEMGRSRQITGLVWSSDDQYLASVGAGPSISLWDARTKALTGLIHDPEVRGSLQSVVLAPTRDLLAAAGEDGVVRLYRSNGQRVGQGQQASQINDLGFSADGRVLASAGWDRSIALWRVSPEADHDALQPLRTISGHGNGISSLSFGHTGTLLASSSWDQTVRLWDVESGNEVKRLSGMSGPVFSCALSPTRDDLIAAGGWQGQSWFWDIAQGRLAGQPSVHKDVVWCMRYSPDGSVLATGSADRTVGFLDAATQKPVASTTGAPRKLQGFHGGIRAIAWSHDRSRIALGSSIGEIMILKAPEETARR